MRGERIPLSTFCFTDGASSIVSGLLTSHLLPSEAPEHTKSKLSSPVPVQTSALSLNWNQALRPDHVPSDTSAEIPPNSRLEQALIVVALPYTPHLFIPIHPQRFLALLTLPRNHPQRPHPALLYILFAEAVRILESDIPRPQLPRPPPSLFPKSFLPPLPGVPIDPGYILSHVQGTSLSLLERARAELDNGIRHVDRPFDLVRAAVGIAGYLNSLGRFIEGWNIPVARLLIACGLHRMTGNEIRSDGGASGDIMPQPFTPAHFAGHSHSPAAVPTSNYPVWRIPPAIIRLAGDEIEMAERNLTFWAAKVQDWAAGIGWGWTTTLADDECITEWPSGWGSVEVSSLSRL